METIQTINASQTLSSIAHDIQVKDVASDTPSKQENPLVLLALDIDGVLHHLLDAPLNEELEAVGKGEMEPWELLARCHERSITEGDFGNVFQETGKLHDVLMKFPQVRIVISSSWRKFMSLETLKQVLPIAISRNTVGVLDWVNEHTHTYDHIPGLRGQLMEKWLKDHGHQDVEWLAVDDSAALWDHHSDRLIKTPMAGLRIDQTLALMSRLDALCSSKVRRP